MSYQIDNSEALLAFIWSFLIAVFAIPSIIYLAHVKKLLDEPNTRTVHHSLTPRLGGLAIFAGFMSALTIFGEFGTESQGIQQVLAGCVIIFFIGLKDDIAPVSAFKKFFVQVLAAGIVMFIGELRITSFQGFLGVYELEIGISYALTFIVIIGITNAINLIDGLDGLAGVIILVAIGVFGYYFFLENSPYAIVACCLGGAVMGFLRYNLIKASIFMGDTGSLVCGFILSLVAIRFVESKPDILEGSSPAIAVAALIIPILDTVRVFLIRTLAGRSPFSPDRNHVHHRLVDIGFSQIVVVLILSATNCAIVVMAVLLKGLELTFLIGIVLGVAVSLSLILELIYNRKLTTSKAI